MSTNAFYVSTIRGVSAFRGERPPRKEVLHPFIKSKLADETALICSDQHKGYDGVADGNTIHATIDHSKDEWVRGYIHTNTLEDVWSLLIRSIVGFRITKSA